VQYLAPAERSGHDISVDVTIDAGVPLVALACSSHKIVPKALPGGRVEVTLAEGDTIPNKDFVLKYKVAADKTQPAMMVHKEAGKNGGYFTLMLYPPADMASLPRKNVEMVFVVDTSGSMSGEPVEQAKAATKFGITHLQQGDTFQVVQFDSDAQQMSPKPVEWSDGAVRDALGYVDRMSGNGGTEMLKGINKALDFPHDPQRVRIVTFMTDGYIGNEVEILSALQDKLQGSRVFSMGVGSSPNRYLLDGMARLVHGAVAYLGLHDDATAVMKAYLERISHPAMTEIAVKFNGVKVTDVYPRQIPDLFVGKPVVITGRFEGSMDGPVEVMGMVGREKQTMVVRMDQSKPVDHPAIATVWARMRLADLYDQGAGRSDGAEGLARDVKGVALEYGLMSPYTAFLAVDSTVKTEGDHGTTVAVRVEMPEGVRYETTVGR
jgi:Ca-activated chloride channel family protein